MKEGGGSEREEGGVWSGWEEKMKEGKEGGGEEEKGKWAR